MILSHGVPDYYRTRHSVPTLSQLITMLSSAEAYKDACVTDVSINHLGSGGASDPLNQRASVVIKMIDEDGPLTISMSFIPGDEMITGKWYRYD